MLLLFDIDRTLLDARTRGVGAAMSDALGNADVVASDAFELRAILAELSVGG